MSSHHPLTDCTTDVSASGAHEETEFFHKFFHERSSRQAWPRHDEYSRHGHGTTNIASMATVRRIGQRRARLLRRRRRRRGSTNAPRTRSIFCPVAWRSIWRRTHQAERRAVAALQPRKGREHVDEEQSAILDAANWVAAVSTPMTSSARTTPMTSSARIDLLVKDGLS